MAGSPEPLWPVRGLSPDLEGHDHGRFVAYSFRKQERWPRRGEWACVSHEFSTLLRFSLLFSLSTLFLCIFSAIFSYLSFSSFAALLSLIA